MLAVVQTHPIQYHAPVYRALQQRCDIPVTAIYGSDFSVTGYRDREFDTTFSWDTDLLSGYSSVFLARTENGGGQRFEDVKATGLAAVLERLRPSAVLIGGYSPHFHRAAFFEAWRAGAAILFRAETTDVEPASPLRRSVRRTALRTLYGRAARLLYIGARSKRHYEQLGCEASRLVFSPYCVDGNVFEVDEDARARRRDDVRAALRVSPEHIVILFSGKLIPKKRPDLLLAAVGDLARTLRRPLAVVCLGDGELRPALEAESQTVPNVRTVFLGFKNQRELSPYYHAADVMVLPSQHSETWGLVVNEALMHGVPCVVSSVVGCGDDLISPGQTGEVFEVGSRESLVAALTRACELVGRIDVREACRRQVSGYSVDRAACGIAQAYRSVVGA
ncbi:MAG TPA: glycosyltransferase family 4 protein [Vicinamibacterales bacterium]